MTFKNAVESTPNLNNAWKAGLGALRPQDRPHIKTTNTRNYCGSADVDKELRNVQPNANRWDFAIGYRHANRQKDFIYWVEIHTGRDDQIRVVLRKLQWLRTWLQSDGAALDRFDREFIWVSSSSTSFTQGATQVKTLATQGLRYVGNVLFIPCRLT